MPPTDALARFAEGHGLAFSATAELPEKGGTLTRSSGTVEGAATGSLPGGIDGILAHFTYTWTDSDSGTHTRRFTLVVTRVPESIGFLPYFGFRGPGSELDPAAGSSETAKVDLGEVEGLKDAKAYAYKGTSRNWLTQLLSPAMLDWLAHSEDDFGFELVEGVLCAGRGGYLSDDAALTAVCEEAAHVAAAIRDESLEEVGTGGTESDAAKDPDAADPGMESALAEVDAKPPADVGAARTAFADHLRRSPTTFRKALQGSLLLALVLNIPGMALPIGLIDEGEYAILAIVEVALVLLIFFFAFRKQVRDKSARYADEAFYRAYAAGREMKLEEPLRFAAEHAEAKLPFKPDRVLTGPLPGGGNGSLVLCGDGSKRANRIAILAGPRGPVAEAELRADPPPLSAKTLDSYAERLTKELSAAAAAG